ncbi:MAG TPA: CbrC family protein [Rhizomicrobium sp.]|nr:CbrC family protein [Rhizomicrobium sp.]
MTALPVFAYHPDPVASGSIKPSDAACRCCGQKRGYVYAGVPYCEEELEDALCPWCIADGAAHAKFGAEFTDAASFPDGIAQAVIEEIAWRTPGFSGWQQEEWLGCCGDAAAFLEPVGFAEIKARYPRAEGTLITYIVQAMGVSGGAAHRLYEALKRDSGPTAYVFQCRHCDNQPMYIDSP